MTDKLAKASNVYTFARHAAIESNEAILQQEDSASRDALLRRTLNDLRQQIESEKTAITEARHSTDTSFEEPGTDPDTHLSQLCSITAAYNQLALTSPFMPPHESLISELLALRATGISTTETRSLIPASQSELEDLRNQLGSENARLHAYGLLSSALRARIKRLRVMLADRSSQSKVELLEAKIESQTLQQNNYVDEGDELLNQLSAFINDHLAPMVAAEELGGPPVGDLVNITDELLGAGFTAKRKAKQSSNTDSAIVEARIEQGRGCRAVASREIRQLIKRLLRAYDHDVYDYIDLQHESAATRYLVQARIAELDPEDARKMRLVDFGGD